MLANNSNNNAGPSTYNASASGQDPNYNNNKRTMTGNEEEHKETLKVKKQNKTYRVQKEKKAIKYNEKKIYRCMYS